MSTEERKIINEISRQRHLLAHNGLIILVSAYQSDTVSRDSAIVAL